MFGTPASHFRLPEFKSQIHFQFQHPIVVCPTSQLVMAQVDGVYATRWETWIEFLASDFPALAIVGIWKVN